MTSERARALFEVLVREHEDRLRAFLRAMVKDPDAVEDLMQETVLTAWRRIEDYDTALPFGPWLRGIARRIAFAWFRRRRAERLTYLDEEVVAELGALHDRLDRAPGDTLDEKLESLRRCLEQLPERQRTVLALHYDEDLGCEEIGRRLQRSREAVKKLLQRGRAWLAECIRQRLAALGGTP